MTFSNLHSIDQEPTMTTTMTMTMTTSIVPAWLDCIALHSKADYSHVVGRDNHWINVHHCATNTLRTNNVKLLSFVWTKKNKKKIIIPLTMSQQQQQQQLTFTCQRKMWAAIDDSSSSSISWDIDSWLVGWFDGWLVVCSVTFNENCAVFVPSFAAFDWRLLTWFISSLSFLVSCHCKFWLWQSSQHERIHTYQNTHTHICMCIVHKSFTDL